MPTHVRQFKSLHTPAEKRVFSQTELLAEKFISYGYASFSKEEYTFFVVSHSTMVVTIAGSIEWLFQYRHFPTDYIVHAFSDLGELDAALTVSFAYRLFLKDKEHPDIAVLSNAFCKMERSITQKLVEFGIQHFGWTFE